MTSASSVAGVATRRGFLVGALAGAALLGLGLSRQAHAAGRAIPFGLQLFSVNEDMQRDLPGTLRAVRAIGYRQVELVGYYGRSVEQLRRELVAADLICESIHLRPLESQNGGSSLASAPDEHFAKCRDLGVRHVVAPGPWLPETIARDLPKSNLTLADVVAATQRMRPTDWQRSADLINVCAKRAQAYGVQFLYHNGNLEFVDLGGEPAFDLLLRAMDPADVHLELDCGWVAAGGHDPVAYLRRLGKRVRLLHIKDMLATPANTSMALNSTEMGKGIVDWQRLLSAAMAVPIVRAYVEQEAPYTRPPLESAKLNWQFIDKLRV